MRLRAKIGLLVGGVLALGTAVAALAVFGVMSRSFGDLEQQRILDAAGRAYGFIEQQYDAMRGTAVDWSEWDDTYAFAGGAAPGFVAKNITPETFQSLHLDAMAVIDQDGRISHVLMPAGEVGIDQAPQAVRELFRGGTLVIDAPPPHRAVAGIIAPSRGDPAVISLSGIFRSDLTGPRRGTLLMCRVLDAGSLSAASAYLRLPLAVAARAPRSPGSAGAAVPQRPGPTYSAETVDGGTVAGYVAIPDMRGAGTLTLRTEERRVISESGTLTTLLLVACIAFTAAAGGVGFLWAFDRMVSRPLSRLGADLRQIEESGDYGGRVAVASGDEIGDVAVGANRTLAALGGTRAELEKSESRYRALFESNPVGTAEIDASAGLDIVRTLRDVPDGAGRYLEDNPRVVDEVIRGLVILAANPAAAAVFGADGVDQVRESFPAIMGQESMRRTVARALEALAGGAKLSSSDADIVRLDGTASSIRLDWRIDESYRLLVTIRDVTAERLVARTQDETRDQLKALVDVRTMELEHTNVELMEATRAKDRFLASMSHELRTPLNSVIGFSSLLSRGMAGDLNVEQTRQVDMIRASGDRLLALVTEILDLSRLEAGAAAPDPVEFRVGEVLEALVESLGPSAGMRGLDLSLVLPQRCPVVYTDRTFFEGIVLNIVGNAMKYTQHGSVTVTLTVRDGVIELRVADTGPGIPENEYAAVFEDFHQLAVAGDAKPQGAGLGLAISRRYARLLGGTITVTSVLGEGSEFVLSIPERMDAPHG